MELHIVYQLARKLMNEHGLADWQFQFTSSRRKFATVWFKKRKMTFSRELTLINTEAIVRNVILHEIAHAVAGHDAGHGPAWKQVARSLGCDGERCYDSSRTLVAKKAEQRYIGTCPNCGAVARRNVKPRKCLLACKACCVRYSGGIFDPRFAFRWKRTDLDLDEVEDAQTS